MRIGVIGAGAIGGTLAALLDRSGHEVVVTARGDHLDAIRTRGIRLTGGFGDHLARVGAAQVLPAPPDLAILAVKAQDAAAAATAHAALLAGVPTVVVQNGLRGPQALAATLPTTPLIGALSLIAAAHLEPGEVRVTAALETLLGPATATRAETEAAAGVLRDAVPVRVVRDLVGAQWSKLVVNQLNAGSAITGLPVQEVFADARMRRAFAAAMRETVRVGRARGVVFSGLLPASAVRALADLPPSLSAVLVRRMVRRMGPVPNLGSTLQSIRRGRSTEIDELSGAVVREASGTTVPTPVNEVIVGLVHEVERTGSFLTPDEASRRLLA